MTWTSTVDPDTGIATVRIYGEAKVGHGVRIMRELYANPHYAFRVLWDVRDASSAAIQAKHVLADLRTVAAMRPTTALGRGAVVAARDVEYGVARMVELMAEEWQMKIRVFRDFEEAEQWLRED